ncbi:MAG: sulfatase-like hydrolase/transferase [bacterium]|nr:sulfatase-like hydrolase/transferase [bacterium]
MNKYSIRARIGFVFVWGICVLAGNLFVSCQQEEKSRPPDKQYAIHANLIALYGIAEKDENSLELTEGKIRQPVGTTLSYYTRLPLQSLLHVELSKSSRKLTGVLEVSSDEAESEVFRLTKKGTHDLDLSQFSGKVVKLHFQVETSRSASRGDEYIEWTNMALLSEQDPSETERHVSAIPKSELFKDYDVVYLLLDAFHAEHASLYGYPRKTTPFFEELAKESMVFENMFANVPYTLTSTATLFTSKYPDEHGLIHTNHSLNRLTPTISELLEVADIRTYLITRHGYVIGDWGLSRGFSTIYKERYGRHPEKVFDALDEIYAKNPDGRKFIYIHLGVPHSPYTPPEEFRSLVTEIDEREAIEPINDNLHAINRGELQISEAQLDYLKSWYDSNILFSDHLSRQIFQYFKERGAIEKTVFIITSDHGEAFLQHNRMLHGTTLFDEMLHIPLLIRFPQELDVPPRRIDELASIIDMTPTIMELFSLDTEENNFSGKNLLPLIFADTPVKPFIYLQNRGHRGIRDSTYKYIAPDKKSPMLFNIQHDPQEQQNLYADRPVTVGYYQQLVRTIEMGQNAVSSSDAVDLDQQNEEVLENLRDLGYIN